MNWKNKKVAILGWGVDTQDVEPWLKKQGAVVTILDENVDEKAFADLSGYEVLVRSPGVYRYRKEIVEAEKKGVIVTSKVKIFFDECVTKNIIGVTGTKGKGTTSSLIYEMLKAAGKDVYFGGNVGKPMFGFLEQLKSDSLVVLELSSFQLMDLHKSPHIAVTLMVTVDHLDWHKDIDEYVNAKSQITRFQNEEDISVFNDSYPNSVKIGSLGEGKKIVVNRSMWNEPTRLRGEHNKENLAAAMAVCRELGIDEEIIIKVGKKFKGLEHRLEEVVEIGGVKYFNDSISTTPETAMAAISAFTEPMILILGGSDKGSDFMALGKMISESKHVKAIVLVGVMSEKIKAAILQFGAKCKLLEGAVNMKEIVEQAKAEAKPGDVVVLSPACASFDMFKNYKDRGKQFVEEVKK